LEVTALENDERYLRAKKKVENLKEFYRHLAVYLLINVLIFAINLYTFQGYWWFIYPLGGWGIGVAMHGLSVFEDRDSNSKWEEKKIKEYMEKDKKK